MLEMACLPCIDRMDLRIATLSVGVTLRVARMSQDPNSKSEIRRFEAQHRQNPDSLVFARLADAYRRAGDPMRALEVLESGIGRHGNYPSAHIVRAKTCMDLGQMGSAEEAFLRVLELDSGNLVALRGLAALARERGDLAGARQWFQRISGLNQGSPDATDDELSVAPESPTTRREPQELDPLPRTEQEWWTPDSKAGLPTVESEPVESETSGPTEAWWFEDPGDGESADDSDLLTRTMAQLYEKQGLVEQAAAIYRELLSDRQDDRELKMALARLEKPLAASAELVPTPVPLPVPHPDTPFAELGDLAVTEKAEAEGDESASDDLNMVQSVDTEPEARTSGQGAVFLSWLRRLGQ